jgi:hypothetical protein
VMTVTIDNYYSNERMEIAVGFLLAYYYYFRWWSCFVLFTFFFILRSWDLRVTYMLPKLAVDSINLILTKY